MPEPRRPQGWAAIALLLVAWLVAGLVGALVARVVSGPADDDYAAPGSALAHEALPSLVSLVVVAVAIGWWRWWPQVLHDRVPARAWAWVFPGALAVAGGFLGDWTRVAAAGATLVLVLAVSVLLVAASEELLFRGFILEALRERYPELAAALVTTLVFGLGHLVYGGFGNVVQGVVAMLSGFVYYVSRRLSRGIVVPVLLHAWWDFCTFSSLLGAGSGDGAPLFEVTLVVLLAAVGALATYRWWSCPAAVAT